jgi:hypothetical protein
VPDLAESRKIVLENFLTRICNSSMLCESDEFNVFMRGAENYETACELLAKVTIRNTRSFYEAVFSQFAEAEVTLEMIEQIVVYEKLIRSSINSIKSFRKLAKNACKMLKSYLDSVELIQTKLGEIEESYISGMRDIDQNLLSYEKLEFQCKVYESLIEWAKLEILDLEAMLEAIASRQVLENSKSRLESQILKLDKKFTKISQGRSTLSNLTQILQMKSKEAYLSELESELREVVPN